MIGGMGGGGGGFSGSSSSGASSANQLDSNNSAGLSFGSYNNGTGSQLLSDWKTLAVVGVIVVAALAVYKGGR